MDKKLTGCPLPSVTVAIRYGVSHPRSPVQGGIFMPAHRPGALLPACLALTLLPAAAHWWRAGQFGAALVCLLWGAASLRREAWMRPLTALLLLLLAIEWFLTAGQGIQLRRMLHQPWLRLALILTGTGAVTLLTALLVWGRRGRRWFSRHRDTAGRQALCFLLVTALLLPLLILSPRVLLLERFVPGLGPLHVVCAALWGAWLCRRLSDRHAAPIIRRRVWLLFSLVFFAQFALGLAVHPAFSMSGEPHIPVPGVIVGGALYRGHPGFMVILFTLSVLAVGAAWCSHLCYFGSWDQLAASRSRPTPHPHPFRLRACILLATCAGALLLRAGDAPCPLAAAGGLLLGILLVPAALIFSRRRGYAVYCTMICPLGLLACLLGRLAPWRVRRTASCMQCGACARACRYGALDRLRDGRDPGPSCVLCRDCLSACPHDGLCLRWAGKGGNGWAEQALVVLLSGLQAVFLFTAMA